MNLSTANVIYSIVIVIKTYQYWDRFQPLMQYLPTISSVF